MLTLMDARTTAVTLVVASLFFAVAVADNAVAACPDGTLSGVNGPGVTIDPEGEGDNENFPGSDCDDLAFDWVSPVTAPITVSITTEDCGFACDNWDAMLGVGTACGSYDVGTVDALNGNTGNTETLTFNATAGTGYVIYADSFDSGFPVGCLGGPGTLRITTTCGNGVVNGNEECDDGNTVDTDDCSNACESNCGNGTLNGTEECDDGASNSDTAPNACRTDCTDPSCGDSVTDSGEQCDDGNANNSDGCPNSCVPVCQDGICSSDVETIFSCGQDCTSVCGDGVISAGEVCDPGPFAFGPPLVDQSDPACLPDCSRLTACGDGIVDAAFGEGCDDGPLNGSGPGACLADCSDYDDDLRTCTTGAGPVGFGPLLHDNVDDSPSVSLNVSSAFPGGLNYFGGNYTDVYVNVNGNITFDGPFSAYTPSGPAGSTRPMIAPFFGDADLRPDDGLDTDKIYSCIDPTGGYGCGQVIITWYETCYYSLNCDKRNTFQLILNNLECECADGAAAFESVFIYDKIEWSTGDASGGSGGTGGTWAAAGFGDGAGTQIEVDGSRTSAVLNYENDPGVVVYAPLAGGFSSCGNGITETCETCDDGNTTTESCPYNQVCNVCAADCVTTVVDGGSCGDNIVNGPEECDDGGVATANCRADCTAPICGDGQCDVGSEDDTNCPADCCPSGETRCGVTCVDTRTDPNNCGGCGVSVDDSSLCTTDTCENGVVVNTPVGSVDDGNACTTDACDPSTGITVHTPIPTDDADACTVDTCDPATGIVSHAPDPNIFPIPSDNNLCTQDLCDPATGAPTYPPTAVGSACWDADQCNGLETCDGNGTCTAGTPVDPNDGRPCTEDTCDPATGVVNTPVPAGDYCLDGTACDGDICDANGNCIAGAGQVVCGLNESCIDGATDQADICICSPGFTDCSDVCVNTNTDDDHCGGCDMPCPNGEYCANPTLGVCEPTCGDGIVVAPEACDDAALNGSPNQCNNSCTGITTPVCGNGVAETGEACDDGNSSNNDGCLNSCQIASCGDGFVNPVNEDCDGSALGGETCTSLGEGSGTLACKPDCSYNVSGCAVCGNSIVEGAEVCDNTNLDGADCTDVGYNNPAGATCSAACDVVNYDGCINTCGDGLVEPGEDCDGDGIGNGGETAACDANCTTVMCDDGVCNVTAGENNVNCPEDCSANCGNGVAESGEDCDMGDLAGGTCVTENFDAGTLTCTGGCVYNTGGCTFVCGNGSINGNEVCDDTNLAGVDCTSQGFTNPVGATCSATCDVVVFTGCDNTCGDGLVEPGEACDGDGAGNGGQNAICDVDCTTPTCGDGICNADALENNATCAADCLPICGNAVTETGEDCDGH